MEQENAMAELQRTQAEVSLRACNRLTAAYGLALNEEQIRAVAAERPRALRAAGRVEFGDGILKKLILAFRDSPNLDGAHYAQTLIELQAEFYQRKNGVENLTDDELLDQMRRAFDGQDRADAFRRAYDRWYSNGVE